MSWLSPRGCLAYGIGFTKLSKLTLEPNERQWIGAGDNLTVAFQTPFYGGAAPTVYVDGTVASPQPTMSQDGTGARWKATWGTAPTTGQLLEALSTDGVNADVLDEKLLSGQAELTTDLLGTGWIVSATISPGEPVLRWSWVWAGHLLVSDPRRTNLLPDYAGIERQFEYLTGLNQAPGFQSILVRLAKGTKSLDGVTGVTRATGTEVTDTSDKDTYPDYGPEGDLIYGPP